MAKSRRAVAPRQQKGRMRSVPLDLAALPGMSIDELRQLWALHMGRSSPPAQRFMLARELAWRTQAKAHGGIDPGTQRLLARAMRDAVRAFAERRGMSSVVGATEDPEEGVDVFQDGSPDQRSPSQPPSGPKPRRLRGVKTPELPKGTRLVRTWRNRRYEVFAIEDGKFLYGGRVFGSLSTIALEITGAHWSGPRFFGVRGRTSRPKESRG